jgi:hypothetical protein
MLSLPPTSSVSFSDIARYLCRFFSSIVFSPYEFIFYRYKQGIPKKSKPQLFDLSSLRNFTIRTPKINSCIHPTNITASTPLFIAITSTNVPILFSFSPLQ